MFRFVSLILCGLACKSHGDSSDNVGFLFFRRTAVTVSRLCGGGRPPSVVRPRTLHVTPRLGHARKKREREGRRKEAIMANFQKELLLTYI